VVQSMEDYAVLTLDLDLSINSWNSGAVKIFKYEEEEIIGKPFHIIFSEHDIETGIPEKEIRLANKNGRATDNRWHICKGKGKIFASGLVFPIFSEEGVPIGYVKILQDKTENKRAEDAIKKQIKDLEELNNHKEDVLAILSHDLRGPLAAIIVAVDYLKTNYEDIEDEERKEIIEQLFTSSKEELDMLDYLLEWARVKYASQAFTPKQIFLLPILIKVLEGMEEQISAKSIQVVNEMQEVIYGYADPKMMISIFKNLIYNAIEHTPKNGRITINATQKADMVEIQIQDTGVGMLPEMAEKLFTPKVGLLSKPRKSNKGGGIGLLLVKGFLEKNNGKIWVESQNRKGTSFYFTLPSKKIVISKRQKQV
nr:PAS domain-containing sensor histidine kinase [Flavobacteriales bacterium]